MQKRSTRSTRLATYAVNGLTALVGAGALAIFFLPASTHLKALVPPQIAAQSVCEGDCSDATSIMPEEVLP